MVWSHVTYDELKKLGLRPATEARMRSHPDRAHPQTSGLLVVDQIVEAQADSTATAQTALQTAGGNGLTAGSDEVREAREAKGPARMSE